LAEVLDFKTFKNMFVQFTSTVHPAGIESGLLGWLLLLLLLLTRKQHVRHTRNTTTTTTQQTQQTQQHYNNKQAAIGCFFHDDDHDGDEIQGRSE